MENYGEKTNKKAPQNRKLWEIFKKLWETPLDYYINL